MKFLKKLLLKLFETPSDESAQQFINKMLEETRDLQNQIDEQNGKAHKPQNT